MRFYIDQEIFGTFVIDVKSLPYYEPKMFEEKLWANVANIGWGQGYCSMLYGTLAGELIVLHKPLDATPNVVCRYLISDFEKPV